MKLLYTLLCLSIAHLGHTQTTCPISSNLQNGLLAFYPFANGSLNDLSPGGHHLNNPGTAQSAADRFGNPTCAYEFSNANNEFLQFTNPTFLDNLSGITFSCWYMPMDATIDGEVIEGLISRGDALDCYDRVGEFSLSLYDCRRAVLAHETSVWDSVVFDGSFTCQDLVDSAVGHWFHLAGTFDGTTLKLYKNGALQEYGPDSPLCTSMDNFGDFFIGRFYTGRVDDVFVYDRALSQSEITELYEADLSCCSALGLNDHSLPTITVYPNPASDQLTVSTTEAIQKSLIYDLSGKCVKEFATTRILSVADLEKGMYMVVIQTEAGSYTTKIQVSH